MEGANMGQIPRKNKKERYSKKYLEYIKRNDFQGRLTPNEVEIARSEGLLKWDLSRKASQLSLTTGGKYALGVSHRPGQIVINDHEELERALKAEGLD